jgi:hypothetical protein
VNQLAHFLERLRQVLAELLETLHVLEQVLLRSFHFVLLLLFLVTLVSAHCGR